MELENTNWLIRGGRVIDPSAGYDRITDVLIVGGVVRAIGDHVTRLAESRAFGYYDEIDAKGMVVAPGFVDLHVHFREPGTEGETIASGVEAAVAGGFTTVCVMPNTTPAIDTWERVSWQHERARERNLARVRVVGALTAGREGRLPSDIVGMVKGGVVALSDDGSGVQDAGVMLEVMSRAAELGLPVSDHAEDACLAGKGVVTAGKISKAWRLDGKPPVAEEAMIARDIEIARATGCHLHVAHISTARGAELVRRAKNDGVRVTAEVTPHHLDLTEDSLVWRNRIYDSEGVKLELSDLDPNKKMNPPLRTDEDREALVDALIDGTIDAIATDHAPHPAAKKQKGIVEAPNGVIGLETAFSVALSRLKEDEWRMSLSDLIARFSTGPAKVFGLDAGSLKIGSSADVVIFSPDAKRKVDANTMKSRGHNTPWAGRDLWGRVIHTFVGGRLVYDWRKP